MSIPTKFYDVPDFLLSSGRQLPARISYITLGNLNKARDNAILVTHGFTSSHRFILNDATAAEGSWAELVGPGKAIDTNRYFVIASNAMGSSYGSTGPADIDVATGKRFGAYFPAITFSDIVELQHRLISSFGIEKLHAVVGVSMGGMQAMQWAVQYPHAVARVGVALSTFASVPGASSLEKIFEGDEAWHGGRPEPGAMAPLMTKLRMDTLRRYGVATWLKDQGLTDAAVDAELAERARLWAAEFDPCSLLVLRRAMETYDVRSDLHRVKASVLLVLCTTDLLFPATSGPEMLAKLRENHIHSKFHVIDSEYGHLASGIEWQKWNDELKELIESPALVNGWQ